MAGNFNYSPERFGAQAGTNVEAILDDLLKDLGTAFDIQYGSVTWIYMNAIARIFNDIFEQNKRLSNQSNPDTMTDFLPRWEKILGISPLSTDTFIDRRMKVKAKMQMVGQSGTRQMIIDLLRTILGDDVFVSLMNIESANATASVPGGAVVPGGNTIPDGSWYSTVSYLPIKLIQPDYMDNETFYETAAQIFNYLDSLVPAFVTYNWYIDSPTYGEGFYLDEPNLDLEAFD